MNQPLAFASASLLLFGLTACSGGGPTLPPDDDNNITANPRRDGGVGGGDDDGGTIGGDTDGGPVGPIGHPPSLDAFEAYQAGRDGSDVLLRLSGSDEDQDVVSFVLRFLDSAGDELMLVDTDLDGRPDTGYLATGPVVAMDGAIEYQADLQLEGLFEDHPEVARIEAFALDVLGFASDVTVATLQEQVVLSEGDPCNPGYIGDRCANGLGCKGEPLACAEGEAPELTNFAYQTTENGYRIRAAGLDPDDDIWRIVLDFQDDTGAPVMLDLDNDGNPDSSTFEIDARGRSKDGSFFVEIEPTQTFADAVERISAKPVDASRREGNRLEASLTRPPVQRVGQSCDPMGFDACRANDVCYPGVIGEQNTCAPLEGQRRRVCMDAPVISPRTGVTTALGVALGASLWDPPLGCAALDPKGKPDAAVILDLPDGAQRVTLSTDLAGTGFNTIIYVIDGCEFNRDPVIGCQDNAPDTIASELVLEDLASGRYLIVVDAWNFGGAFELEAYIEP